MIIDCHGHYTTPPAAHHLFRQAQIGWLESRDGSRPQPPLISADELAETVGENQLRTAIDRGIDVTLFSPRAAGMEHHVDDPLIAADWARHNNDLIARIVGIFPENFAGVCQLPQTPGGDWLPSLTELERCVTELGFVGCNLNPDPSGGSWDSPPITDEFWFPIFEKMCELDVPAMLHVSASTNPSLQVTGAHYLNSDTAVFMQLLNGDLFSRFPTLRLVIPHGGGAVPYHWGRYRGLADRLGRPPLQDHLLNNVYFDTCVYHLPGIQLLFDVVDHANILFASEALGAVRTADPDTGVFYDDTKRYVDQLELSPEAESAVFQANVRRVYPRLDTLLATRGYSGIDPR